MGIDSADTRKGFELFRKKFDLKEAKSNKYLVSKLLKDKPHLYSEIDCYFSSMDRGRISGSPRGKPVLASYII